MRLGDYFIKNDLRAVKDKIDLFSYYKSMSHERRSVFIKDLEYETIKELCNNLLCRKYGNTALINFDYDIDESNNLRFLAEVLIESYYDQRNKIGKVLGTIYTPSKKCFMKFDPIT